MSNWQDKRIGRYQIIQQLPGRNNACSVWLATDPTGAPDQKVAIKMLPAIPASNRAALDDIAAQIRAVAALEHPHILAIQDFGEQESETGDVISYLVTPYIAGETLAERIRSLKGMLPIYESLRYLRQAARALDYAHHKQMIHRGVRPENMFVRKGWLQLADFGVTKMLDSAEPHRRARPESRMPEYMAPEAIEGKEEAASDRYSLAVIAYRLFTGHFPFQGKTAHETLSHQMQEEPPEPRQFNTYIPLEVVQVLMRGLAKRPENRPASCAEFLDALEFGWKASGQSDEGPDTTWLAPWSKHWSEGDAADEIGYSGELAGELPEQPSWLPEPLKKTLTGKSVQPALPAVATSNEQTAGFPELPSWLPQPFKGGAQATREKHTPSPQPTMATSSEQAGGFPELPSWLPQPFKATQSNQSTQISLESRSKQSMSQPLSPLPPPFQQSSFDYQEAEQSSSSVVQKPLSFDSVVRNVMAKQASGEMPTVSSEPAMVQESSLPRPEGIRHYESFSGVVKEAIAARQQAALSPVTPLNEPLVSRDNTVKFEAVVKQAMGVKQSEAGSATSTANVASAAGETPLPATALQETRLQRWQKQVGRWQQRLRAWLQQAFAQSKQQLQRAYLWCRPRLLRVYVASKQWLLSFYAWIVQLVGKYVLRNKK